MPSETTQAFLEDLIARQGKRSVGNNNTAWFLELDGAAVIEPTAFPSDPATHRGEYYYDANTNALYKKIVTRDEPGIKSAYWQKVSN